jgi:hypothetical protein
MSYTITSHSKEQANKYGVIIKPSRKKNKKIDVYKNGDLIASIGHKDYNDYGKYLQQKGKQYADKKRIAYKKRHKNDLHSGNGMWADRILW